MYLLHEISEATGVLIGYMNDNKFIVNKGLTQLRMSLVKESEVKRKKNGGDSNRAAATTEW